MRHLLERLERKSELFEKKMSKAKRRKRKMKRKLRRKKSANNRQARALEHLYEMVMSASQGKLKKLISGTDKFFYGLDVDKDVYVGDSSKDWIAIMQFATASDDMKNPTEILSQATFIIEPESGPEEIALSLNVDTEVAKDGSYIDLRYDPLENCTDDRSVSSLEVSEVLQMKKLRDLRPVFKHLMSTNNGIADIDFSGWETEREEREMYGDDSEIRAAMGLTKDGRITW